MEYLKYTPEMQEIGRMQLIMLKDICTKEF